MRRTFKGIAVAAAAAVIGFFAAGPAAAAPYWQPLTFGLENCGATTSHEDSSNLLFQTCILINSSGTYAQSVLVVRNNNNSAINLGAGYANNNFGGDASCLPTSLGAGLVTTCLGPTKHVGPGRSLHASATLMFNGSPSYAPVAFAYT